MANLLKNLRAFANGAMDESALIEDIEGYDFENDEQFMQECADLCMPTLIQMALMESADGEDLGETMDDNVRKAFLTVQDYLVGQGIITEAATVSITNPKINVVRLNKQAQISRLTTIITLKMARKDNIKPYQKYKLGQKIKKENMESMRKRYGAKAEKLAKKLWERSRKNGKIASVVEKQKGDKK